MLLVYPYCFILFLNSDTDLGVREGEVHLRWDLRKSAKEVALKERNHSSRFDYKNIYCTTYPMATAFVTAFSTPPAADTCAPTFQGLSKRSRNVASSKTLACSVDICR